MTLGRIETRALALWLGCVFFALPSCAPKFRANIQYGKTTETQLRSQLGEPLKAESSKTRSQARLLEYPDNQRYQVENGVVVAGFREPETHESTLQYWKHQWKGVEKTYAPLASDKTPHGSDFELRAPSLGLSVVYRPSTDRVIRVVEYVAK